MAISSDTFDELMRALPINVSGEKNIAVAVSGGGDSMALSFLLADWCATHSIKLHALTVDHGLRPESADEAQYVAKTLRPLGVKHKILKWEGVKPKTRLQESAREARYGLMSDYCNHHKIKYLFLAHHADDQLETILFRLAKGTGMDGLAGMQPAQSMESGLILLRPLLSVDHNSLLSTLQAKKISWIEDPSNQNNRYARVRIRNICNTLKNEGLSPERLETFSNRVNSTLVLIDHLIEKEQRNIILYKDTERIEINYSELMSLPFEGKVRIIKSILADMNLNRPYPVRLQDVEKLVHKMEDKSVDKSGNIKGKVFRGATLGHCIFKKRKEVLIIMREDPAK